MTDRTPPIGRDQSSAATGDLRDAADYVVEHEDIATAANLLRTAQDEIDRLRGALGFYAIVKDVNAVSILLADCGHHARKALEADRGLIDYVAQRLLREHGATLRALADE